jgi:glucan biosynthesis protein
MKTHESAPLADQGVSGNSADQFAPNWHTCLVEADGLGFLEHQGLRNPRPLTMPARLAFQTCAYGLKRSGHALKVMLASVALHDR